MDYNTDYIDFNSLIDSFKDLLDFQSVKIVNLTLLCFVTITNKCSQVVFHLKDLNLFPKFISFLTNDFISASLNLIGNLCIPYGFSEPLLELGLFDKLMNLLNTEHKPDVFNVLSNLIYSIPKRMVDLFDQNFIDQTINNALSSSYKEKKEATYFLATLLIFESKEKLDYFMNQKFFDLFLEMLNCNIPFILSKMLPALIILASNSNSITPLITFAKEHNDEFISFFDQLNENKNYDFQQLLDSAKLLLDILNIQYE